MNAVALNPGFNLRRMGDQDIEAVVDCERAAYEFPWSADIFRDCLRVGYNCWVMEQGDLIVGHGIMSIGVGECHVLNLCVHPRWQRMGVGRRLLRRLLALARSKGADTAFLEVRVSNLLARALYGSEGFCEIGERRGYYPARNGREDAVVLARTL
jgi:ribosomal-protein-alanine N-acetyltransferase